MFVEKCNFAPITIFLTTIIATAMKELLLFSVMFAAAFSVALSAQDMEQTVSPSFIMDYSDGIREGGSYEPDYKEFYAWTESHIKSIVNEDQADATIYYRTNSGGDWRKYNGEEISFTSRGMYIVEAYAQADGKQPSDIVSADVFYMEGLAYAACLVDGISYRFNSYDYYYWDDEVTEVFVTSYSDSHLYSLYSGDIVIPSEIVFMDKTFNVTEIYYNAFASTLGHPCKITSMELPNSITHVWQSAFAGCENLNRIVIHAGTPPYAMELFEYDPSDEYYSYYFESGYDANALYDQVTLFVPNESIEEYRAHGEWGKFTHIVPFIGAGPGDVNGDGTINIKDVTDLIDQLLSGGEGQEACMDLNGDGTVSIKDVTDLIDRLLSGN